MYEVLLCRSHHNTLLPTITTMDAVEELECHYWKKDQAKNKSHTYVKITVLNKWCSKFRRYLGTRLTDGNDSHSMMKELLLLAVTRKQVLKLWVSHDSAKWRSKVEWWLVLWFFPQETTLTCLSPCEIPQLRNKGYFYFKQKTEQRHQGSVFGLP